MPKYLHCKIHDTAWPKERGHRCPINDVERVIEIGQRCEDDGTDCVAALRALFEAPQEPCQPIGKA